MYSIKFRQIRAQLVGSAGVLALTTGAALAQSATFSLPPEPLSDSLKAVARQTGQNILFTPQSIAGMTAPALRGEMSGKDAVNALLKGTNLEAAPDGDDGLIVRTALGAQRGDNARPATIQLASLTSDVAVTIEPAGPAQVIPLVVAAHGLTERERDVVQGVLGGSSTNEIAQRLHVSPYTVQDHLKGIFDKLGVSSRRELSSRIFFEHYIGHLGDEVGSRGWFV